LVCPYVAGLNVAHLVSFRSDWAQPSCASIRMMTTCHGWTDSQSPLARRVEEARFSSRPSAKETLSCSRDLLSGQLWPFSLRPKEDHQCQTKGFEKKEKH
jgi:hypothetical protein